MRIYGPNLFKKHMYIWPEPNPLLHNKYMYMYDTSTGSATVAVLLPVLVIVHGTKCSTTTVLNLVLPILPPS